MPRSYKELKVWQKAVDFAIAVYAATESFPKSEIYGLINQMRRSAVSIASNIAEGSERKSDKDFVRFLRIVKGSLAEFETQNIIAHKLGYLDMKTYGSLSSSAIEIGKMLNGLSNSMEDLPVTDGRRLETIDA